jgi:PleD family two-component response regulator
MVRSGSLLAVMLVGGERARCAATDHPTPRDPVRVPMSAGVADLRPGAGVDALLSRADEALHAANAAGRDRPVVG